MQRLSGSHKKGPGFKWRETSNGNVQNNGILPAFSEGCAQKAVLRRHTETGVVAEALLILEPVMRLQLTMPTLL